MKKYSSYEVSQILGCDETTIRRWANKGKITCQKSAGGHRYFTIQDIRSYLIKTKQSSNLLPINNNSSDLSKIFTYINDSSYTKLASVLAENSIEGDESLVHSIINNIYLSGENITVIFDEIIEKAFDLIESKLINNSITHIEEYIARKLITRNIESLSRDKPNGNFNGKNILCINFEDNLPDLGIVMSEVVLRHSGFNVYNTGSHAQLGDLKTVIVKKKIDILLFFLCSRQCCKSISELNLEKTHKQIKDSIRLANELKIKIIFGGDGLDNINSDLGNTFSSFGELSKMAMYL